MGMRHAVIERTLHEAVAAKLQLPLDKLAVKTTESSTGQYHFQFLFKGLEAISHGYELEKAVLANQFNPVPGSPIHRLYMEEVFDCGAHALGATHEYDGTNDGGVEGSLPDSGWRIPTHSPTAPTPSPTQSPTAPQCTYRHVANTNIPHVLCNRGNSLATALRSGCSFNTLAEAQAACESVRWSSTCEGIVKDGFGYNLRGNSASRPPGHWSGISSWWRTCNGVSMVHGV